MSTVHTIPAPQSPVLLGDGIEARIQGDTLTITCSVSQLAISRAQPTKSGALCMVAGAPMKWRKADSLLDGLRINVAVGVPNPAHDKDAAKLAKALKDLEALKAKVAANKAKLAPVTGDEFDTDTE